MIISTKHVYDSSLLTDQEKVDLWKITCEANDEFIPQLSSRNSTVQQNLDSNILNNEKPTVYFEHMLKQKWLLAKIDDKVVGFMSYREEEYGIYLSTVIVLKEYRNHDICRILYYELEKDIVDKIIRTRTWSTNYAHIHILEGKGFNLIKTIKDDRGPGIDTVYFEKKC